MDLKQALGNIYEAMRNSALSRVRLIKAAGIQWRHMLEKTLSLLAIAETLHYKRGELVLR